MDRWIRSASMVVAKATTRRGLLAGAVRGLVGAGLGAGFLFGAQGIALANSCCCLNDIQGCSGWSCEQGDNAGCSTTLYGLCSGCGTSSSEGVSCPTNYAQCGYWTCCCSGNLYVCKTCSNDACFSITCECEGGFGYCEG